MSVTTASELARELRSLRTGEHLCLVYDNDPDEQLPAVLPYLQHGLDQGERCIYVADDQTVAGLCAALTASGIDVERAKTRGALLLWTRDDWRQPGELDSAGMEAQVRTAIADALAAGFSGVRFGVEMTWTLGPDIDAGRLAHWEATINRIFTPELPARIICQYSRRRLSPAVVQAGLLTHPLAIIGDDICTNPFYEGPLILDRTTAARPLTEDAAQVDWMVSQLRWARSYEREREKRLQAESELDRLKRLYDQAQAATADLRDGNARKDQFLGLVSHELRTPITTVIGNGLLLLRQGDRLEDEDRRTALSDIVTEARKLQRIIENLLLLTRMELGHKLDVEPVSVPVLVEDAVTSFQRRHPSRELTVNKEAVPVAMASPGLLGEVMDNLLGNADKYSPIGAPVEVIVRRGPNSEVEVCVRDAGAGIDEAEAELIFGAFYRSPAVIGKVKGLGLGLAVCKRVIEAQGGRIWAQRRADGGSEFFFTLPAAENEE